MAVVTARTMAWETTRAATAPRAGEIGAAVADREREQRVAVRREMRRGQRARESVHAELGETRSASSLPSAAVVATTPIVVLTGRKRGGRRARGERRAVSMSRRPSAAFARSRDEPARLRIAHVPHRVHGDERARRRRRRARPSRSRARPSSRSSRPRSLPTVAPVPAPTLPSATGAGPRGRRGRIAHGAIRPRPVIAHAEVVEDGAGDVRHRRSGSSRIRRLAPRATA